MLHSHLFSSVLILLLALRLIAATDGCKCNAFLPPPLAEPDPPVLPSTNIVTTLSRVLLFLSRGSPGAVHKIFVVVASMHDAHVLAAAKTTTLAETCIQLPNDVDANDTIAYAAYAAMSAVFAAEPDKILALHGFMSLLGFNRSVLSTHISTFIARPILAKYMLAPPQTPFMPSNSPSTTYDAACPSITNPDAWQPLCIPSAPGAECLTQKLPFALLANASYIHDDSPDAVQQMVDTVPPPPTYDQPLSDLPSTPGKSTFADDFLAVLDEAAALDDRRKAHSEVFAPPAFLQTFSLALSESIHRKLSVSETINVLFPVSIAARDAVVTSVRIKLKYDSARPITVLQCAYRKRSITSWRGAYAGVSSFANGVDGLWRPFLNTPPFPGYVSGHSAVSAAAAFVLVKSFPDGPRAANCHRVPTGGSVAEPLVQRGVRGFIENVTDVPGGSVSTGYTPSESVSVCWSGWYGWASLVSRSRLWAGIHVQRDNDEGLRVGWRVGQKVWDFVATLDPSSTA